MNPFEKLCEDLGQSAEAFSENERLGAGKSLAAVNDYLDGIGVPGDLSMPLLALLAALEDLDNGKQPEMLKAKAPSHAPPVSNAEQMKRAQAAAAMQVLVDAGDKKEIAARAVARGLEKNGARGVTWTRVARWRDELNTRPKDDPAVILFQALANEHKVHNLRPRDVAKALMEDFGWQQKESEEAPT